MISPYFFFVVKISLAYMLFFIHIYSDLIISFRKDKKYFENMKPTIWFVVENVREEYKKMKGKGISFLSEPFEIKTGFAVEFEDPFGNRLGITDYCKKEF